MLINRKFDIKYIKNVKTWIKWTYFMPKLKNKYRLLLSRALLLSTFTLKGRTNEGGKMRSAPIRLTSQRYKHKLLMWVPFNLFIMPWNIVDLAMIITKGKRFALIIAYHWHLTYQIANHNITTSTKIITQANNFIFKSYDLSSQKL